MSTTSAANWRIVDLPNGEISRKLDKDKVLAHLGDCAGRETYRSLKTVVVPSEYKIRIK
jgi:hypothetical protein